MKKDSDTSKPAGTTAQAGIIIITHSNYGAALLAAGENILGPLPHCMAMSVDITVDVEETVSNLRAAVKERNQGNGVLILTDMFGGTPTNLSLSLLAKDSVEVVTGVNLPMLLRAASSANLKLKELAEESKKAAMQGIVSASDMLGVKKG